MSFSDKIKRIKSEPKLLAVIIIGVILAGTAVSVVIIQLMIDQEVQAGIDAAEVDINSMDVKTISVLTNKLVFTVNVSVSNPYGVSAKVLAFPVNVSYKSNLLCVVDVPEIRIDEDSEFLVFDTVVEIVESRLVVFTAFGLDYLADGRVNVTAKGKITISAMALFIRVTSTAILDKTITL